MRTSLALALAAALTLAGARADAETVVLRGATVLPQEGPAVADADLVIEGGKVVALGARGKVAVPAGARVVDATGRFVIPGLIDVHAHVGDERIFGDLYLSHGVTTVRDMGNRLELSVELRRNVEEGKRLGPEVVFVGPILDGNPPMWPGISEVLEKPEQVAPLLARLKASGISAVKVYERLPAPVYDAIVKEAAKLSLPVVGHIPEAVGVRHAIDSGQDTIEHLDHFAPALQPDGPERTWDPTSEETAWTTVDEKKERELIAALVAHKTRLDPTRVVIRDYSLVLRGITPDEPEARFLGAAITKGFWGMFAGRPRADAATDRLHEAAYARSLEFVKRAHAAGVPILAGSDTPNPWVVPGISLVEEIEELAKVLGPEEALRCATLENARALGRSDLGRIVAGARADLVVLAADPRKDARALESAASVFVRGHQLDGAALAKLTKDLEGLAAAEDNEKTPGWSAIEGDLASAGEKPRGPEVRLEGGLAGMPPTFWLRIASFETKGGGTRRVLRSSGSFPMNYTAEETLELSPAGATLRYHVVRDMAGERREATLARGEGAFHVAFALAGKTTSETTAALDQTLECVGGLLLYHALEHLDVAEGKDARLSVRSIDLDRLTLGEATERKVHRNTVRPSPTARQGVRSFVLDPSSDDAGVQKLRLWIAEDGALVRLVVDVGIGKFEAKEVEPAASTPAPAPTPPSKPAKKFY